MDKDYSFDLRTRIGNDGVGVTQDVSEHLEWAKHMREITKSSYRQKVDTGFKPFLQYTRFSCIRYYE